MEFWVLYGTHMEFRVLYGHTHGFLGRVWHTHGILGLVWAHTSLNDSGLYEAEKGRTESGPPEEESVPITTEPSPKPPHVTK